MNKQKTSSRPYKKSALSTSLGMALYGLSNLGMANEIPLEIDINQEVSFEVVEVVGVRRSLESALNTKREANSIVDSISASDINALPALDLGEALQAVPGVQVNREGSRRRSDINLRGLPGSFVRVTANGQSFATPSRSTSVVGSPNPFGAFDASVFDGVTVIKSPTARHQSGGVAGIIDKQLQSAFDKKDGAANVSIGQRYEELNDSFDNEFRLSASKHLIPEKLAVAFKVGYSEQNFRRDSILFERKETLDSNIFSGYDAWLENQQTNNPEIPDNAIIKASSSIRQLAEISDGDRLSFTSNISFHASENFSVDVNALYTKRTLQNGQFEQVSSSIVNRGVSSTGRNLNFNGQQIVPTADSSLFLTGVNSAGTPIYAISDVVLQNADYSPASRDISFFEEAAGIFINADYETDDWLVNTVLTSSQSDHEFDQLGFDFRVRGGRNNTPTGIETRLDTGLGNLNDINVAITGLDQINVQQRFEEGVASRQHVTNLDDTKRIDFFVLGRHDNPKRNTNSAEFNVSRFADFSVLGETFVLDTIHFGGRFAQETLENRDFTPSAAGINVSNIDADFLSTELITNTSNTWFNGEIPNALTPNNGWITLDYNYVDQQLRDGFVVQEGLTQIPNNGYIARTEANTNDSILDRWETNFDATETITAWYAMADISGNLGTVEYTGNIGVRSVNTEVDIDGARLARNNDDSLSTVAYKTTRTDEHVLPSLNLAFHLSENLIARVASNRGVVRPNLRSQTPVISIDRDTDDVVAVSLPKSNVAPYTADSHDLTLEWYNREGSAISVGVFEKTIEGLFQTRRVCPGSDSLYNNELANLVGEIEEATQADGETRCVEANTADARQVIVNETVNGDEAISVKGYELAVQQNLSFLPYPWNGFGGVINYSRVESTTNGEETLFGISPNSYNVIGYYENDGLSLRLAYNYRDEYQLDGGENFGGPDQKNVEARGQLDFAASYQVLENLRVYLRGFNLTNEQRYEYVGQDARNISRVNYDGRTYNMSISYTF